MASIRWTESALTYFQKFDSSVQKRILAKINWLGEHHGDTSVIRMKHELKGLYKLRIGDYRLLYSVREDMLIIEDVGHRSEVYE